MYYKKIKLTQNATGDIDELLDPIWRFAFSFESNGQILKNYKLIKNGCNCFICVTTPKQDSLDEKYDGYYVKLWRNKVLESFDISYSDEGTDVEGMPYCECHNRRATEMCTTYYDINSAFVCLDCGKPIALYELPTLDGDSESDHSQILGWQENYSSIFTLWVNGLCDRYTGKQLVDPNSALKSGDRYCYENERKTWIQSLLQFVRPIRQKDKI